MFTWFTLFRFLHILAAIIAFGPSFVFPILGSFGGKEPMHGNFALRVGAAVEDRLVIPFALTMPISGILMLVTANGALPWLRFWFLLAVALYVIAMFIAVVIQRGIVHKMIHMTSHMPAPAAGPGAAPAGPPPEFLALVKRSQMNGMILTVLLVVIVILMIFRPLS
jgi:predicted integral membrane protein DUF2269